MISLHPEPHKVVSNHAFTQTFCLTICFPRGIFGSHEKNFSFTEGNLGFLERDYLLPKGEMTLDKVLRSPHGKLNTPLHFDSHTFSGNCKLNSLLTSSQKCEDSCTWFLCLNAIWTYYFTLQSTASNNLRALITHGCGKSKTSRVITC